VSESAKRQFLSLADADKQIFLARISLELTIVGRAQVLDHRGDQLIAALSGLNELQHTLSSQIAALGAGAARYPDDVFWSVLCEKAATYSISDALDKAIRFAESLQKTSNSTSP
jgi:hypothetical protein